MNFNAMWIWKNSEFNTTKQSLFFRKNFNWDMRSPASICVSADSRYKLYINGKYVLTGPLKGDHFRKYYDIVDITSYLIKGKNCIAAHVLRMNVDYRGAMEFHTGPISLVNGSRGGFWLDSADCPSMNTSKEWKCKTNDSYVFVEARESKYAGDQELCLGEQYQQGWNQPEYEDSNWQYCEPICPPEDSRLGGVLYDWQLTKRTIPLLFEKEIYPNGISKQSSGMDFSSLLKDEKILLPPDTVAFFDVDMGELVNAYVTLPLETDIGGATITLTYSEAYFSKNEAGCFYKGCRDNAESGELLGEKDTYRTGTGKQTYEPFWFRTFRYLKIKIETSKSSLKISAPLFRLTGYPLVKEGSFKSEKPLYNQMWDVSVRTLERCMLDTYVDCPYYEQMQYVMDTMIEALLTYQISGDDKLARKAIDDFHSTRRPDGMISCNAPASFDQIIPIFSIYFIDMVYYHFLYFGDRQLVAHYMPTIIGILQYFEDRLEPQTGLVGETGYWSFVDWVDEWRPNHGSPVEKNGEVIYLYSQIYAYGLSRCADLCGETDLPDLQQIYRNRYQKIVTCINTYAFDEKTGFYRTHPTEKKFSQHAQLWAVLSGCVTGERAANLMRQCMQNSAFLRCSYSMSFYLFRALEKAGIYNEIQNKWMRWEKLLDCHLTTWPEDNITQRSDCHAWSAVPIYDFMAITLGIRPTKPGYEEITIQPHSLEMGNMEATLPTPKGLIFIRRIVQIQSKGQTVKLEIRLPEIIPTHIYTPDSKDHFYMQREIVFEYMAKL